MFFCYILQSQKSGRNYTGHAEDLDVRLHDHNRGHVTATRGKGPWILVHFEPFETRPEAARRERQIKSWKSAAAIRKLIEQSGSDRPDLDREGR